MALQGTLDTFALPDVLRLLAATKKAGRLRVTGDGGSGSLWLDTGAVTGGELLVRGAQADNLTDVLFNLLRFEQGSFNFEAGATPPATGEERDVESLIIEAELMLGEWRSLALVVPSLSSWLTLAPELKGRDVVVDAARWRIVVTIGSGATVGEVGRRVGLGDLAVMRAVKEVIELGLVDVSPAAPVDAEVPVAVIPAEAPAAWAEVAGDVDVAVFDPVIEEPAPVATISYDDLVIGEPAVPGSSPIVFAPLGGELDERADIASYAAVDDPVTDISIDVPVFSHETPIAPPSFTEMRSGLGSASLSEEARREPSRRVATQELSDDSAEIARQLASLSPRAAKAVAAAAKATTEEEREAALAAIEAEDATINRGVLLKFLGAVDG